MPAVTYHNIQKDRSSGLSYLRPPAKYCSTLQPVFVLCLYLIYGRWPLKCQVANPTNCNVAILLMPVATKDFPISPRFSPYEFLSRCHLYELAVRKIRCSCSTRQINSNETCRENLGFSRRADEELQTATK